MEKISEHSSSLGKIKNWFQNPEQFKEIKNGNPIGVAIITGRVSGNLFVIDFDNRKVLAEFLSELYEANPELYEKLISTWIAETGKGYHYYLKLREVKDPKLFSSRTGIRADIDIRAEGGYVVAPPSPHPSGKVYRFVNKPDKITELTWDEYLTLLRLLEGKQEVQADRSTSSRESKHEKLPESKILEIVNLLRPIYRPGYRHYIIHYLSAWCRKAGVDYDSAKKDRGDLGRER